MDKLKLLIFLVIFSSFASAINVTLISPVNNAQLQYEINNIELKCNVQGADSVRLFANVSGQWAQYGSTIYGNQIPSNGLVSFTLLNVQQGNYKWNCFVNSLYWANNNYTFYFDFPPNNPPICNGTFPDIIVEKTKPKTDVVNLNKWLGEDPRYDPYENLPKIISEWGYDSEKNQIADTAVGAAHTIASLRNLISANIEQSFLFEIKDGPSLSWGILTHDGQEKPRYQALKLLNELEGSQLIVDGEGSNVSAIASKNEAKIVLILTNYDESGRNYEAVPVTFKKLNGTNYKLTKKYIDGRSETLLNVKPISGELKLDNEKSIIMQANTIVALELIKME